MQPNEYDFYQEIFTTPLRDFLRETDENDQPLGENQEYLRNSILLRRKWKEAMSNNIGTGPLVKFLGRINYVLFPKNKEMLGKGANTFGIVRWTVEEVKSREDEAEEVFGIVTVKGDYSIVPLMGKDYIILARQVEHEKYGLQYNLVYISENVDFSSEVNQKAFLSTFLTQNQVREMYEVFENPLSVIGEGNVQELMKVKGVGPATAARIIENYNKKKDNSLAYTELDGLGLTNNMIEKLLDHYQNPVKVVFAVKNDPYSLIELDGIGFKKADIIAAKVGVGEKSVRRIAAFIKYFLTTEGDNGHSYVTAADLLLNIYNELGGRDIVEVYEDGTNNVQQALESLQEKGVIGIEQNENRSRRRVFLSSYYKLEREIAENLYRLKQGGGRFYYQGWEDKVAELEKRQGFEFSEEQKRGILVGLQNPVSLITGSAGSGKSSLVSGILAALPTYTFAQTALSGKASARLQEVTGVEGKTIHRLLGYNPQTGFNRNKENPLDEDIVVLDEISLVGGSIFLDLLKAIPTGHKLIMLGDPGQLEAIGPLNLAADMMKSHLIANVGLKEVHRQAKKSGILTTAYAVRAQEQLFNSSFEGIEVRGELQDMILDMECDRETTKERVIRHFQEQYNGPLVDRDIMNIQVLSPVRERGDASVYALNLAIQEIVNPVRDDNCKEKFLVGRPSEENDRSFYIQEGDKVMCVHNNYKLQGESGEEVSVFNGWIGIVEQIDLEQDRMKIDFPLASEPVYFPMGSVRTDIVLGYASTVHKMQGSDYKVVIGAVDYSTPPNMLTCQLIYTLITRAKKLCILVGQSQAICKAISNNFVSSKRTFLPEFLKQLEESGEIRDLNFEVIGKDHDHEQSREKTANQNPTN